MKVSDETVTGTSNQARAVSHDSPGSDPESEPGRNAGARTGGRSRAPDGSAASEGVLQIVLGFVEDIVGSASGLIEVYADRARLSARKTIVRAVLAAAGGVCAAVWLGASALAVLRGVCGGFTALFGGRAWLGDLTGGLLAMAAAAGAIALYLRLSSRREFRRLKAKYERLGKEQGAKHGDEART